uniref:MARVEL domain-containing protein n=1 Tax=Parastrongyloides trichosuri TaxID=131310 RepID=A0A0N4ZT68_PARTI
MGNFIGSSVNRTVTSNNNNTQLDEHQNANNIINITLNQERITPDNSSITDIENENISHDPISNSIEVATINANSLAYQKKILRDNQFNGINKGKLQKPFFHRFVFFGYFLLTKSFYFISIIEIFLIISTLTWTILVIIYGEENYENNNKDLRKFIPYILYIPVTLFLILWAGSISVSIFGAKYLIPYLFLPNIIVSLIITCIYLGIFINGIIKISNNFEYADGHFSWPVGIVLSLSFIFIIVILYFLLIKCICFMDILRKRKTVQVTDEIINIIRKQKNEHFDREYDSISETFSTKSTVIVSDEFIKIPKKL